MKAGGSEEGAQGGCRAEEAEKDKTPLDSERARNGHGPLAATKRHQLERRVKPTVGWTAHFADKGLDVVLATQAGIALK